MSAVGRLGLAAAGAMLACATSSASAQAPPGQQTVLEITVQSPAIVFPVPGVADFDAGLIDHPGTLVSIRSRPASLVWELRIRADAVSLGTADKPVGHLLWRTASSTVWTPLSVTDQIVLQGRGDAEVTVLFRMRLDWATDIPGSYTAPITFTAVRP